MKLVRYLAGASNDYAFPIKWSFKTDKNNIGLSEKWQKSDFSGWAKIRTDNFWGRQEGYKKYPNGIGWYAIKFSSPVSSKGRELYLYFGSVDGTCDIFLDGIKVGEQKLPPTTMWNQSFSIALKNLTKGEHTLVVRVEKHGFAAGIWKPVALGDKKKQHPKEILTIGRRFIEVGQKSGLQQLTEEYGKKRAVKKLYATIRNTLGIK